VAAPMYAAEKLAALETSITRCSDAESGTHDRSARGGLLAVWRTGTLRTCAEMPAPARPCHRAPASLIARLAKATARAEALRVEAPQGQRLQDFAPMEEVVPNLVRTKRTAGSGAGAGTIRCLVDALRRASRRRISKPSSRRYRASFRFINPAMKAGGPRSDSHA